MSADPSRKKYGPCNFRPVNNFAVFPLFKQFFDMGTDPYFLVKVWCKRNLPNFFLGPLFVQPMVSYYPCKRRELWTWRKKIGSLIKQQRRRPRWQEFAYLTMKNNSFARFARAFFFSVQFKTLLLSFRRSNISCFAVVWTTCLHLTNF